MGIHWLNFGMSSLDLHTHKSKINLESEGAIEKDLNYPISVPALFWGILFGGSLEVPFTPSGQANGMCCKYDFGCQ